MVGTNTVLIDNPILTTRNHPGDHPIRIVLDRNERIPKDVLLLTDKVETWILTQKKNYDSTKRIMLIPQWELSEILETLFSSGITRLLVEGGANLLQSFINENLWDQTMVITSRTDLDEGIKAPRIKGRIIQSFEVDTDHINIISRVAGG
jgi:diaminohydroxyphosphoribosylaminopyrimidine deaminase/5-amino-6-(5-phosphoribosylamino)uracil reductase